MKKLLAITALGLMASAVVASTNIQEGLSSCRFSSAQAAIDFASALDGNTRAAARLSRENLSQVESCSSAMTLAIKSGVSYEELSKSVVTNRTHIENGMELTIELRGVDFYNINKNELLGSNSNVEGDFDMVISVEGERNEISQAIPTEQTKNNMKIEIISKDKVRIIDEESGINTEAKAIINKTMFGKLKSLSITAEELERALKPMLDAQGISMAKGFNMNTSEGSFSMDYKVSAMDCSVNDSKELACGSSFIFHMSAQF